MPSRKQRRRREKLQRHEYEYVIETDEGEEVVERPREKEREEGSGKRRDTRGAERGGRRREVPKPSLQRVMKRTAIFTPLIFIVVFLTSDASVSMGAKLFTVFTLLAFFIPFSYLVDVLMYRMFSRRQRRDASR